MKRWLWISGWAVTPEWLAARAQAAWPDGAHAAVRPGEAARAVAGRDYDVLGGYSLGAWWLLRHAAAAATDRPVLLLAPFFSFCAEDGAGGAVSRARLRQQRRQLRRAPAAALAEFARHAGLPADSLLEAPATAAALTALEMELGWLDEAATPAPPPASWRGWLGAQDPLLHTARLRELWPALRVVPGAGHAPGPLLEAAAKECTP